MATVRQSITALYEQSRKSAAEGQPMFAIVDPDIVDPDIVETDVVEQADSASADLAPHDHLTTHDDGASDGARTETAMQADISTTGTRSSIARRFDDLRALAEREAGDASAADSGASTTSLPLPSEPPAPPTGDALSDLDLANIQQLVQQAWEDEPALAAMRARPDPDAVPQETVPQETIPEGTAPHDTGQGDTVADHAHDIDMAMEEIAAAVVKSGNIAPSVDMASMKAELVAAMRAELQDVLTADLRPMIKAAIAEAMQDLPTTQPKPRARKAASGEAPSAATPSGKATPGKRATRKKSDG